MPKSALFGRYVPGESPLHRMDSRAKLLLALVFVVATFAAQNFVGLAVCAIFIAGFYLLARIPLRQALRSIAPLAFILVLTALFNVFFIQDGTVLAAWGPFCISEGGILRAVFVCIRLLLLLVGLSLITLTTATLDITDAFEYLLKPASRIGLPAHELSMIMGIALRFVPQFVSEVQTIYRAQVSRGANMGGASLRGKVRMISALIVPLFTSAFRHAETLSLAMDARCYHGGSGRSRLSPLRYGRLDLFGLITLAAMLALVIATNFLPIARFSLIQ